ncbi:uncharacterized protein LOC34619767 [Cyclospora cayetanensis]|uniref:Uncharacterized protein LOC34619767 n=1 Tax=Cyclospora cayetanensis TaxID=88456 RepID=A0A6P6RYM5_9EIME|nr:uncharacterized protein LOC34619767 [Cyclospora cayetanensis]
MGFRSPYEGAGEPRLFEVYGSSTRLAFSRYFVVSHVDGFLYVLDKYFCIYRLVPARADCHGVASSLRNHSAPVDSPGRGGGWEANQARGPGDGRSFISEHRHAVESGHVFSAEDDQADGGKLLVQVQIADVFSALFVTDKPIFSQLLTGSNQYDQRQLQGLRQKSLLLSNRQDGCLYLFLKKFLIRVSLNGSVTVVGNLLQLALSAAARVRANGVSGAVPNGTCTGSHQPQNEVDAEAFPSNKSLSPTSQLSSLHQLCRELGYRDAFLSDLEQNAPHSDCGTGVQEDILGASLPAESVASASSRGLTWQGMRPLQPRVQSVGRTRSSAISLLVSERLEDFLTCRGENWEVNNCCIDGEGHCFFTITREKFSSPFEERGMIFCLDTKGTVVRARVLRFGRGVSDDVVMGLSLTAHPSCGCILMIAKSAASVRESTLSPAVAPLVSSAVASNIPCHSATEAGNAGEPPPADSAGLDGRGDSADMEEGGVIAEEEVGMAGIQLTDDSLAAANPALRGQGTPDLRRRHNESLQSPMRDQNPSGVAHSDTNGDIDGGEHKGVRNHLCSLSFRELVHPGALSLRSTREVTARSGAISSSDFPVSVGGAAATQSSSTQHTSGEAEASKGLGEHTTWWFCPCDEDPTFYFPVAECIHDEAIHEAAQSICRQYRGSPSSSVCKAHFEDTTGAAVREAKAAARAAYTAERMILHSVGALARNEDESGLVVNATRLACNASKGHTHTDADLHSVALKTLGDAVLAAARAESVACSGFILWQPGVKVRRPKTGEEAINFGSAILIRSRTTIGQKVACKDLRGRELSACVPHRALESISGEPIAVISQDARHLEVRDAIMSPLGLVVVPAEAANRIVKQSSNSSSGRLTSRNTVSLTSFLASFVVGNPTGFTERGAPDREENEGGSSAASAGQGSRREESRQSAADMLVSDVSTAATPGIGASVNAATAETNSHRAIPAVNIVFLMDTLRVCRFAETRPATSASPLRSHQRDGRTGALQAGRDLHLLGFAGIATTGDTTGFPLGNPDNGCTQGTGIAHETASVGGGHGTEKCSQSLFKSEEDMECSCKTATACLSASHTPVLHSQFADVVLLCANGVELLSHRALLAARCSFFEAKLTRPHWEGRGVEKVVIDLRDFPGSVVQATVNYFEVGYFVIPASCCCHVCCVEEQRRSGGEQFHFPIQRGLPPYESHCCCQVDWVLQAYTFAAYCLLQDLQADLICVLARLISQRTCLYVLTHPAVRNKQQILQLAAHQLVHHMPMPSLLLEGGTWPTVDSQNHSVGSDSSQPEDQAHSMKDAELREPERKPLLPMLLNEGLYEATTTALCAWVLGSGKNALLLSKLQLIRCGDTSSTPRKRLLLVLLALRLAQESILAPFPYSPSRLFGDSSHSPRGASRSLSSWECSHSGTNQSVLLPPMSENTCLVVPLRESREKTRCFLFRDIVFLWAKLLQVPEADAKAVAQAVDDSCLP